MGFALIVMGMCILGIPSFVGAGIGYDFQQRHATNSLINFSSKMEPFSWQMMAGLAYPLFFNTEMTLEYKFNEVVIFYNHSIGVGLIYKFGCLR